VTVFRSPGHMDAARPRCAGRARPNQRWPAGVSAGAGRLHHDVRTVVEEVPRPRLVNSELPGETEPEPSTEAVRSASRVTMRPEPSTVAPPNDADG
jgi:hypothetical protein